MMKFWYLIDLEQCRSKLESSILKIYILLGWKEIMLRKHCSD